jgi:hypothetical protein
LPAPSGFGNAPLEARESPRVVEQERAAQSRAGTRTVKQKKGKPDDVRVNALYDNINDQVGEWLYTDGQVRHAVQQIIYVAEACESLVETIRQLEATDEYEDRERVQQLLFEMKSEMKFLQTLLDDREFSRSLSFIKESQETQPYRKR